MLIESKLEVHAHHREVISLVSKDDIERRDVIGFGGLELTEESLWVTEYIFWSNKSFHCSVYC